MSALTSVTSTLGRLIRRLSSPFDGERLATVAAMERVLGARNLTFHDLAAAVDRRSAPASRDPDPVADDDFSLREIVLWILDHDNGALNDRERQFVTDMDASIARRRPTERQVAWLRDIFLKLRRRRP